MFKPASLYIGLRYTRSKRRNNFVSFISLVSMLGIAISLIVLITVLSVFNGFDQQIRQRIFNMAPHITVTGLDNKLTHWQTLQQQLMRTPKVISSTPYVNGQALLTNGNDVQAVLVNGILPQDAIYADSLGKKMIAGHLNNLKASHFDVVLGATLAESLGVIVGDKINMFIPQVSITPVGVIPRARQFTVVGIFDVGNGFGFNSSYAFIQLQDAQRLFNLGDAVSGIQLKVDNLFAAPVVSDQLQQKIGTTYQVNNWTDQYGAFYHAVKMEKTMMFLILVLIVFIAVFNLLSGLVMAVTDKQSDIAILRTIGATPTMIMKIFIVQGSIIGVVGTVIGLLGGLLLASHVTETVSFLQHILHRQLFTNNVYFVNYLPSKIELGDVVKVCVITLLLSVLSTIYPSWRAAKVQPASALRYD
ncbi:MAG: lipoprotein-releasing ABC transporter permease subunit [Pseudomonadota bacterium]